MSVKAQDICTQRGTDDWYWWCTSCYVGMLLLMTNGYEKGCGGKITVPHPLMDILMLCVGLPISLWALQRYEYFWKPANSARGNFYDV